MFTVKHAQRFKGPTHWTFRPQSTKTELNVHTIKVKRPIFLIPLQLSNFYFLSFLSSSYLLQNLNSLLVFTFIFLFNCQCCSIICSIKNTFYTISIYTDLESTKSRAVPAATFKLEGKREPYRLYIDIPCDISYDTSFSTQNTLLLTSLVIMLLTFTYKTLSKFLTSLTLLFCLNSHAINIMWWKNLEAFIKVLRTNYMSIFPY